jgi:hypothetical protein
MNLLSTFINARCLFLVLLFGLVYFPKSISAFSTGQGVPCIDSAATSSHGANSGGLSGITVIRIDGYVRRPGTTVTIKDERNIKILIQSDNAIGLMLYLKGDDGERLTNRLATTSANMTRMVCSDTTSAALIHRSSDLKPRESVLLNAKGIKGTMTLSISVLVEFSQWYYGTIKLKVAPAPVKTPVTAPVKTPVTAPVKTPVKAPVRMFD